MLAAPSRWRPMFSRQQSHRTTRRTPDASSTGFQPVSSHRGQVILVEMTAKTFGVTGRAAEVCAEEATTLIPLRVSGGRFDTLELYNGMAILRFAFSVVHCRRVAVLCEPDRSAMISRARSTVAAPSRRCHAPFHASRTP